MNIQEEIDKRLKEITHHEQNISIAKAMIKQLHFDVKNLERILQKVNEIIK